jgi:alanine dehydrogenase
VTRAMVESMTPGSVIVDIAVDQGGCIETTRPTDYARPTYTEADVVHFAVTNMPGAVPRTATQALSGRLVPYIQRLAVADWQAQPDLAAGVNVQGGRVVHPGVWAAFPDLK